MVNIQDNNNDAKEVDDLIKYFKMYVKGQDHVIQDLSKFLAHQLENKVRNKPIACILFLGSTATGKTQLEKAIANYLFGNDRAMLSFDCSVFSGPESKCKLIGVPIGYYGSFRGGMLTRPVMNNPNRLIHFDEIQYSYYDIYDILLQVMLDGRLTEVGTGKTADYTQSIVVLEWNRICYDDVDLEKIKRDISGCSNCDEVHNILKTHLLCTKRVKPELIEQLDRIYFFQELEEIDKAEICILYFQRLANYYGLELGYVDPISIYCAMVANDTINIFGIRELKRIITDFMREKLIELKEAGANKIRLDIDPNGELIIYGESYNSEIINLKNDYDQTENDNSREIIENQENKFLKYFSEARKEFIYYFSRLILFCLESIRKGVCLIKNHIQKLQKEHP